jgi:HK97 family phage prohead protease
MMDKIAFDCEFKFADGAESGTVEGYASVFGILDRVGDIALPGAFKASLAEWKRRKKAIPMLWQHNPDEPIGVWPDVVEDEKGLKVSGSLVLDVPRAAEVRALMLKGAVGGISIGYRTLDYEIDRTTGVRRLKKLDLWEISLVTFPALPEAQVSGVKTFNPRELEEALRDEARLSGRDAKAAVSIFRKHALRDAGLSDPSPRDGASDVILAMRKAAATLRG